ncbi:unnamed protein product [Adineta steineri]|uniref:C2 domain-containing protein n=3 Tax=Adineta steineri TaxID=433720 RepID=A0A819CP70_9BILA|nr:unnamed protein product [Adineta steineri]
MLKVTVHNAERISNGERSTNVDPLVTLIFQGVKSNIKYNRQRYDLSLIKTQNETMGDANINKKEGILQIIVHNSNNVPSSAKFLGSPDPYVNIFYHGVKKQTNWQRSTCDPKWDETFDFPLNGIPIQNTDMLEVQLKDHETIGSNKLIGQGTVPLSEVLRAGTVKRRVVPLMNPQGVALEATKLFITMEYLSPDGGGKQQTNAKNGDPNQFDDVPLQNNGETAWMAEYNADLAFKRQNKPRSTKPQDFQIRIKIFQARQLDGNNLHPVCRVRVVGEEKQTKIQKGTNQPYFNEVFFFNINMSEADLCDEIIEFEVCNSRTLRADMKIGAFKMDIGYIYSQLKHSINRKWLLLSDDDDKMSGSKGYLKVTVNILGPGDEAPSQENDGDDDDIESNLLRPAGLMLRPATFILKVYKADDLPRMDSAFFHGMKKIFTATEDIKELIDPYVNFSFAGQQVSSKIVYTCSHPEFNQELRLGLKFPSMCDKITLTVMDWDRLTYSDIIGVGLIDVFIKDSGFLPTFGPCWINLYGAPREYSDIPTALDQLNTGKGEGVAYRGRVFVELQTILGETPSEPIGDISNSDIIRTLPYQSRKKYKLHAAFLDASMLYEHESTLEFEISIGNYGNKFDDVVGNASCSTTPPTNPVFDGTSYYFLPWGHTKPCVQVSSEWEDVTFRLEAMNQLSKIKLFITGLLSTLDLLRIKQTTDEVLLKHYKQSLDMVIAHLKKPLPEPEVGRHHVNELDRLRRQMRLKDLSEMIKKLEDLKLHAKTALEVITTLEDIKENLEYLEAEPQNSIPDVIIWLLSNGKRYAYYRLPANEVFYSSHVDRRGRLCGKVQTITLKWPGKESDIDKDKRNFLPGEIRVKIWLGLAIHEQDWLSQQKGADLAIYAETYENQSNVLGQWTTGGPLMSRPSWSDVTGTISLPQKNFQLPPGWRWEGDWYISPEISARYADDAGHRKFTEEVYEHQSRIMGGAQWQPKAVPWTDLNGDKVPSKTERIEPPPGWVWEDEWCIDANRAVDEDGFEYCVNQTLGGWCPTEKVFHLNRRRRWYRTRVIKKDAPVDDKKGNLLFFDTTDEMTSLLTSSDEAEKKATQEGLRNEGWEYAPMFNMKFHADERSMDMTRRRRWHRKMVPSAEQNMIDASGASVSSTDVVFRMQSQVQAITDSSTKSEQQQQIDASSSSSSTTTTPTKDVKIELNAPRMYLSFKKAYFYELRAYIYSARNLLSMDHDSFSDPFAQIGFINQSQRTEVIEKSLCPTWDQTLIFSTVELYGEPDEIHHDPPNILIELFDKDQYGAPDFLGRVQCPPIVRLVPDETKPPVKLKWFPVKRGKDDAGELLAAFELFLLPETDSEKKMPPQPPRRGSLFIVPQSIRPQLVRTGIEILSWGIRNMKTFMLSDVDCPQVVFEVGGHEIESTIIKSAKKTPNFDRPLLFLDVMLPKEDLYAPPMNIKVKDHRSFGRKPVVGFHVIKSLESFRCDPNAPSLSIMQAAQAPAAPAVLAIEDVPGSTDKKSKKQRKEEAKSGNNLADGTVATTTIALTTNETDTTIVDKKSMKKRVKHFLKKHKGRGNPMKPESKLAKIQKSMMGKHHQQYQSVPVIDEPPVEEDIDWWSKYYASKGELNKCGSYVQKGYEALTILSHPLELHEIYEGFSDFCRTFQLSRGKTKFEEENEIVGEFKGLFKVYPLPEDPNEPLPHRIMENLPSSSLEDCIVRVYIIRATDLQPTDSNGKSDPYIEIELGKTRIDNRDERIPNTTNPIFGKMFELKTVIPTAKDLTIRIKDWDLLTSDDVIGQTTIDLENRFLSKYRATCGLPLQFNVTGPNQWRDSVRPRKILFDVCKRNNLPVPELIDDHTIKIGESVFHLEDFEQEKNLTIHVGDDEERLALYILHKLRLCPEHVETRPLFNPLQPLIEQGRLELFVDIFPKSQGPPGPVFDITPRKPKPYVLRCIVWNTSDVILQETSITGEKMSDIYVKGWMSGNEDDVQKTDIHYRSMDGEGNFNWRFVYDFLYLPAERCISVKKKEYFWSYDATELAIPPVLNLQVWDNDKFSADDFLGALTLDLNRLYKPAKNSEFCTLDIVNDESTDYISLFEMKRIKGWWPCVDVAGGDPELTGKLELELEILTEEEAAQRPAGRGQEEPNENPHLDPPQRPETSFLWFQSPFRTFKNIIWRKSKWYIIGGLLLVCFILFLLLFLWSMPAAIWARLLRVPG